MTPIVTTAQDPFTQRTLILIDETPIGDATYTELGWHFQPFFSSSDYHDADETVLPHLYDVVTHVERAIA